MQEGGDIVGDSSIASGMVEDCSVWLVGGEEDSSGSGIDLEGIEEGGMFEVEGVRVNSVEVECSEGNGGTVFEEVEEDVPIEFGGVGLVGVSSEGGRWCVRHGRGGRRLQFDTQKLIESTPLLRLELSLNLECLGHLAGLPMVDDVV